ncbi:geranylgeranyl pyrophosphate synthase isoform X2 [Lagenorhynchus albirostris]|uniref:geranylgeranyl pyrophosphate synthase isoform X2 n=1 Tax=Lagenorhynchus albirostris TaxID=27610 RepID=UPI0028F14ACE|nr:geranylgeranyl pyrophosphate synthase isoform X2 [Lagenorhynchus albirostris]
MEKTQETAQRILLEPYKYLLQLPGKQVRTKLSQAFNHWLKVPEDKLQIIIEVTEMLHNASLLIDDIEDNSKLRRGFPVAHSIYGIPSVINSANYVYFLGLEKVLTLDHPDAVKLFTRQLLELHQGQGLDIYWRDNYTCPTEEEYKAMVLQKTGPQPLEPSYGTRGTSLVAQLRIHLPMQGTWVHSLILEDPTCCGEAKPVCHSY